MTSKHSIQLMFGRRIINIDFNKYTIYTQKPIRKYSVIDTKSQPNFKLKNFLINTLVKMPT